MTKRNDYSKTSPDLMLPKIKNQYKSTSNSSINATLRRAYKLYQQGSVQLESARNIVGLSNTNPLMSPRVLGSVSFSHNDHSV